MNSLVTSPVPHTTISSLFSLTASTHFLIKAGITCDDSGSKLVLSAVEGPVLSAVEGPVLSAVEGPVLSAVEGPVLSAVEGPVLSAVEGLSPGTIQIYGQQINA